MRRGKNSLCESLYYKPYKETVTWTLSYFSKFTEARNTNGNALNSQYPSEQLSNLNGNVQLLSDLAILYQVQETFLVL
jgi:hypothetical protein